MTKIFFIIFLLCILLSGGLSPTPAVADSYVSSKTVANMLLPKTLPVPDDRTKVLKKFLNTRHSPLAPYAQNFIDQADKNGLDWRLLPAIAGVESGFGVAIPGYSHNAWGFGIYGNNVRRFFSWEEGIMVVSQDIRNDYVNVSGTDDVYVLGSRYAASKTWAYRVQQYMSELQLAREDTENSTLSISL